MGINPLLLPPNPQKFCFANWSCAISHLWIKKKPSPKGPAWKGDRELRGWKQHKIHFLSCEVTYSRFLI